MKRAFLLLLVLLLVLPLSVFAQDDTVDAVAVFRTEDGAYVAILPEGWVADGSRAEGLRIGNSQETLDMMLNEEEDTPASGMIGISVTAFSSEDLMGLLELDEEATEVDLLNGLLELLLSSGGEEADLGEVGEIEFDKRPAATVTGTLNAETEAKIYLHHLAQDTLALTIVATPVGELQGVVEDVTSIITGVGYSLELTETYTSEDGSMTFMYPADTFVTDSDGVPFISSDEELPEDVFEPGQYGIVVIDLTAMGMVGEDMDTTAQSLVESVMEEGDEMNGPFHLLVNEEDDVTFIAVSNSEEKNEGGVFLLEKETGVYAVIFVAAHGYADTISATALNVLYSVNETEDEGGADPEATEEDEE
jgi:hypothetical protein